jgi:hypothetical protein
MLDHAAAPAVGAPALVDGALNFRPKRTQFAGTAEGNCCLSKDL